MLIVTARLFSQSLSLLSQCTTNLGDEQGTHRHVQGQSGPNGSEDVPEEGAVVGISAGVEKWQNDNCNEEIRVDDESKISGFAESRSNFAR